MRNKGVKIEKGILDYPKIRKREEIYLTQSEEEELVDVLKEIKNITKMNLPPPTINKAFCKKCAYYELCYI